ncbi:MULTISPECIES: amino acid ABC transporter permease [Rhizobium/Agrobacterium group]|uniref:amino acid ABC transporter permease n=1 Tax=Rhizobium/Agrobacterium group TaxID=227290 RepID=UPI00110E61CA|nr:MULTISPECIES: amino acid ABC transporter permease [Rhizobium/Agrobacterium group]NWJ26234.1 amino acid ABC transporter permease [Rhizobium sp. RM]TMV20822.1 amino acid ABC transporter permease [Rhizobium sp. Td3]UXS01426.1 amino acid ABC transporter permease [Agrobacterium tumefaciens]
MTDQATIAPSGGRTTRSLIYDPKIRSIAFQILTIVVLVISVWWIGHNVATNLARSNTASGYGFLAGRSGFDIGDTLIEYSSNSTYGRALVVGFLNTLMVAAIGIVTATIIGFIVGIGRLSGNWLIAKLCTVYVEVFRNIPPLLVIFFWYSGVLRALPNVRESLALPFNVFLNNRGLVFPKPIWGENAWMIAVAILVGIIATVGVYKWATKRQMATGQRFPILWTAIALIIGLPLITFLALGAPITFDIPVAGRFNLTGGGTILPEFFALYLALSFYTAAFIAEIIRAGIRGVSKGQTEASTALGVQPGLTTRLVVVPQAMRIIIPPLTSQYLNLTKNSSLGVAIGYPELVSTGGTTMNQTGQAVEIVSIWIVVYLSISLATSLFMNWFNAKMALVER